MVALRLLHGLWLCLLSMWPLLGSCSNSTGADYRCGQEGVQLRVSPGYLGGELSFQVRGLLSEARNIETCIAFIWASPTNCKPDGDDARLYDPGGTLGYITTTIQPCFCSSYLGSCPYEFDVGYDLHGCILKCLLSTRGPKGESIFYSPYTICLAVQKEGVWLLRVRLVGHTKSEDLDLICPKPKKKRPREMHHTPRPRSSRISILTTSHPLKTTQAESLTITRLPSDKPATKPDQSTESGITHGDKVTTKQTETLRTMVTSATKDLVSHLGHRTEKLPQKVTSARFIDFVATTESSDELKPSQCVIPTGRIACLNATVSRDTCLGYHCCHDPVDSKSPCYYGHAVTLHCFPDGLFRLILSRYVTTPPLRLSSVVLGPGNCPYSTILGDFLEFRGHLPSCSTGKFLQGRLMYELSLTAEPDVRISPLGSITRDSSLAVLSQCLYNTLANVSLVVVAPQPPTVTSTGVLIVELRISKGSSFSSFYTSEDFPLQILLRELVFLEARLLQPSDPRLHLHLHHCWAAPSMNPASTLRWPVIYDGCPFSEDYTMTKILPGSIPSSYQRFAVSAFTFVSFPHYTEVYFFCSMSVCLPSLSERCTSDCANLTRSRRAQSESSLYSVGTTGPLIFQQKRELGLAIPQHLTSTLPGIIIAVTLLLIMLLLVGAFKVVLRCGILN